MFEDFNPFGDHDRRLEAIGQNADDSPGRVRVHAAAPVPRRTLRDVDAFGLQAVLEENITRYWLIKITTQRARLSRSRRANLHHFDLAVRHRVRAEKTAIREAEPDPGDRRLLAQQRQEQELTLDFVVWPDRALKKN